MVVVYSYVGEGVYKFTEKVRGRGGGKEGEGWREGWREGGDKYIFCCI